MPLPELLGHAEARAALGRAARDGTLPQSILLHGPPGAGKERLGLWLAQLIVCGPDGEEPCGACAPCRRVLRLEHPDVHWFFPLPRPEAGSPEKLRDRLEEQRAQELRSWREQPVRVPSYDRPPAHYLAAIRTVQQLASVRPSAGSHKVFVIGDAELMVPQEASPEAANAFLKLLEEPPPATTLVLTSSQPGGLLPTIRSRVLALRVAPLGEPEIARLLSLGGLAETPRDAERIAARARGSLRRAVRIAEAGTATGSADPERQAGRELLLAALTSGGIARLAAAHNRRPAGARGGLVDELASFAEWLRDLAAVAAGATDRIGDREVLSLLTRAVERRRISAPQVVAAMAHVSEARALALGNVNPQLIVADLLKKVQVELIGPAEARSGNAS